MRTLIYKIIYQGFVLSIANLILISNSYSQSNFNCIIKKGRPIKIYPRTPKNSADFIFLLDCNNIIIFNKSEQHIDYMYDPVEIYACGQIGYTDAHGLNITSEESNTMKLWTPVERDYRLTEAIKLETSLKKIDSLKSVELKINEYDRLMKEAKQEEKDRIDLLKYQEQIKKNITKKLTLSSSVGLLVYWSWSESDLIMISQSFKFSILNQSKKSIKYIHFNVVLINPVNDIIGNKTLKGVGPIKNKDWGTYEFENAYFSKVVDKVYIKSIKIEYTDGTVKTLLKAELDKVILTNDEYSVYTEN